MSSNSGNPIDNQGFTIPKKSLPPSSTSASSSTQAPHPDQAVSSASHPPLKHPLRSNRKLLPTRATRTSDASARKAPEWEGMATLLSQFHNRADAGENYFSWISGILDHRTKLSSLLFCIFIRHTFLCSVFPRCRRLESSRSLRLSPSHQKAHGPWSCST